VDLLSSSDIQLAQDGGVYLESTAELLVNARERLTPITSSDAISIELNDGCEAGGHQDEMITSLCDARDPRPSTAETISMDVLQNPW
jgi:hypothetical protein